MAIDKAKKTAYVANLAKQIKDEDPSLTHKQAMSKANEKVKGMDFTAQKGEAQPNLLDDEQMGNNMPNENNSTLNDASDIPDEFEIQQPNTKVFEKAPKITNSSSLADIQENGSRLTDDILNDLSKVAYTDADISDKPFNPLEKPIVNRGYTNEKISGMSMDNNPIDITKITPIPEAKYNAQGTYAEAEIADDLLGGSGNGNSNQMPPNKPNANGQQSQNGSTQQQGTQRPKEEPIGAGNTKNLSGKQKRDAVEKTADAILQTGKSILPLPFIMLGTINTNKIEDMHDEGLIDKFSEVPEHEMPLIDFAKAFNMQVQDNMQITDEEIETLREPLIDVLDEKQIALTPTQRLIGAVVSVLAPKAIGAFQFFNEGRRTLKKMSLYHQQKLEILKNDVDARNRANGTIVTPQPSSATPNQANTTDNTDIPDDDSHVIISETKDEPVIKKEEAKVVDMQQFINGDIKVEKVVEDTKENDKNDIPE
jgi:hypothetical protein